MNFRTLQKRRGLGALSRARSALLSAALLLLPLVSWADNLVLGMTRGDVQVLAAGRAQPIPVQKGQALRSGDRVYTGRDGWTVLMMPDGSRVVLTANSEFMVRSHDSKRRTGTFALLSGMLRAMISPSLKSPPHYRFNTLTAVAGVRGTDFSMINRGQANVFFGNNGKVEVQGLNTAIRPLTAATVVQTTRGELPTQPIAIEPNSPLAEAQSLLNSVTEQAPASWVEAGKLPEIVARWNITYSRYLADAGRSEEALHVLQVALDLTDAVDIQADARLERGAVFSRDPAKAGSALKEYVQVLNSAGAGPQREIALYMTALGHYQLKQLAEAQSRLQQYLRDYPEGRYKDRVETLLRSIKGVAL
jgi:tetratricopeptide (TPR) repeat protein